MQNLFDSELRQELNAMHQSRFFRAVVRRESHRSKLVEDMFQSSMIL